MKLLVLLALAAIVWRMVTHRWPWQSAAAVGGAPGTAERRARNLLGVASNASREDIIEAHRRLIAMVHPDRGGTSGQVHEANEARDLLLARLPRLQER